MEDSTFDNTITLVNFTLNEKGELVYMFDINRQDIPNYTLTCSGDTAVITFINHNG